MAWWWLLVTLLVLVTLASGQRFSHQNNSQSKVFSAVELDGGTVWCQPCECGVPNRMERIVGGWPTNVNEYPWVVALSVKGRFYCGGTIINDLYVLTAAHCVRKADLKNLMIVVAEHNKATMDESMVEIRGVARIIVHMDFDKGISYNNDIALLKLDRRLTFRDAVAPVCLPYPDEQFQQALGKVTGWGHTKEGGPSSMELRETDVAVMSNSACHEKPGYGPSKVNENMMCAGLMQGGRDSCQGDSGGSLIVENWRGRMFQAGIVSWGVGCARPDRPGVYTRVNNYLAWIIQNTRDACYCF